MARQFFYSGSTRGFYVDEVHKPHQIPSDAVPITEDRWTELLNGQADGFWIGPDENGYPILNEYPPLTTEEKAAKAREERDQRLTESDWTQLPDTPEALKATWAPYRQALRDVPAQAGFPDEISWPTSP
jgi:hypothetical protein